MLKKLYVKIVVFVHKREIAMQLSVCLFPSHFKSVLAEAKQKITIPPVLNVYE